jgi:ribosomal protein S18 acetylase RimI-like enzyme
MQTSIDPTSPLDNAMWVALTTWHAHLAEGTGRARRYPVDVVPFGAIEDTSAASFEALAALLGPGESVLLLLPEEIVPPPGLEVSARGQMNQMVRTAPARPTIKESILPLGADDVPDMMALVELTLPGPFGLRTHHLGRYFGMRVDGRLVAMAGERLRFAGHTEISGVCTHPAHRGRGYAGDLVEALVHGITERGDMPFLHFRTGNPAAALYERLGFTRRRGIPVAWLKKPV